MTAALRYLSRKTDEIFEARMSEAAKQICESQRVFRRDERVQPCCF